MFENQENRTELSQMGEFGLIEHIRKNVKHFNPGTLKGIGDDAAVIDQGNKLTVVSTDMLVEGIHFDLSYVPLKHLGYKAVTVNLSDIYAMNATPQQITVSVALSNRFSLEAIEELYSGMMLACKKYNVDLVGGDTTTSRSGLVISITAIGSAEASELCYRSGAKVTDLICVSGDLGGAYTGLQILEREKSVFLENPGIQPELEGKDYILERQLKPEARKDIITWLQEQGIVPTSMIDISDGLSSELLHIAKESGVGCKIYESKIPIDHQTYETARELNLDPTVCALNGGEDYELLFTVKITEFDRLRENESVTIIGHIAESNEGCMLIDKSDNVVPLTAQGWNHLERN